MSHVDENTAVTSPSTFIAPPHLASGPTLLPGPVASLVSLISKSTSVSIRLGSLIGGTVLDGARIGTLTGLELGRAAVEGILNRAGRDVHSRRGAAEGGEYVEGWTDKGISLLRSSISLTQLLLSTGFEISSTTLNTFSSFAETYVLTLDSIFGSTESSRAISAIVTLIRKEFDENTEGEGALSAADLVIGLTCFAVLQMKTRTKSEKEIRIELVWDVVVDEVAKADITAAATSGRTEPAIPFPGNEEMQSLSRDSVSLYSGDEDEDGQGSGLPPIFFAKLPPSADISIKTSSTTTQTTTVEVFGTEPPVFTPPEGAVILSESSYYDESRPRYKIVYETITKKMKSKRVKREDDEFVDAQEVITGGGRIIGEIPTGPSPAASISSASERAGALEISRQRIDRASSEKELPLTPKEHKKHRPEEGRSQPAEANSRKRLSTLNVAAPEKRRGKKHKLRDSDKDERHKEKRREKEREKERGKEEKSRRESISKSPATTVSSKDDRSRGLQSLIPVLKSKDRHARAATEPPIPSQPLGYNRPKSPEIRFKRTSSRSRLFRQESSISGLSDFQQHETFIRHDSASIYSQSSHHESLDSTSHTPRGHIRSSPSIYTIAATHSQTSLLLESNVPHPTVVFPNAHIYNNFAKYMRFAAASYGQNFMRFLGIGAGHTFPSTSTHHAEHHAFSYHTQLPLDTILLSSYADMGGGYDSEGNVNTGIPLVHFVAVDHPSKAIVVTCRGTLGLEDVLTDLTCEYHDLHLRGINYRVHKGMLNSALLLLKKRSRLLVVVKTALEEFKDYGLVLTGHSLGGGVAAILAILLSSPSNGSFVTSNVITAQTHGIRIPEGRRIHCYAFGTPACISEKLRRATRTLITTVVHGRDVIPCLSFGIIRDFWTVAVAFKEDNKGAKAEIRRRILDGLSRGNIGESLDHDDWAFAVMKTLRAVMSAEKLVPPGEVWNVTTEKIFVKDDSHERDEKGVGVKRKIRVKAFVVEDVKKRFQEVGFASRMMGDHSPYCYEMALDALRRGVEG